MVKSTIPKHSETIVWVGPSGTERELDRNDVINAAESMLAGDEVCLHDDAPLEDVEHQAFVEVLAGNIAETRGHPVVLVTRATDQGTAHRLVYNVGQF